MDNTAILREWFDRVNSDRTGNITAAQLKSAFAIGNLDFPLSVVQQMIRMCDFDRKGTMSFQVSSFVDSVKYKALAQILYDVSSIVHGILFLVLYNTKKTSLSGLLMLETTILGGTIVVSHGTVIALCLPSHIAITEPCDTTTFEYVISLVGRRVPDELEMALLTSIATLQSSPIGIIIFSFSRPKPPPTTHIRLLNFVFFTTSCNPITS
ncbi:hypothetical protein LWI29_034877 [Acer saccharum]|uniref:EF-hand domain-containing protein n=1 Tax=Acer saccharum TaxID=4024 RepID=A0AA39VMG9_ACESA|nr:hypothetical protein LWI29_034877 [Acer saccharum]